MALSASTIFEINSAATASNINGGGFNPTNANGLTDLAADTGTGNTNSPVVSTAFYSFVSSDIGAWIYIVSGTNWVPGWYQIASVSSGKATLSAAVGQAVQVVDNRFVPNTVAGCATTGTPTSGTFLVDYSQGTTWNQGFSNLGSLNGSTTLTDNGANSLFTRVMVGNLIRITSGTNFTVGWYEIVSFTDANNIVLDRSPHGANTASVGVGKVGGALSLGSSDDAVFELAVSSSSASTRYFIKGGTYTIGGTIDVSVSGNAAWPIIWEGYGTIRGDRPSIDSGNQPVFSFGANSLTLTGSQHYLHSISFTGTPNLLVTVAGASTRFINCKSTNTSTTSSRSAFNVSGSGTVFLGCEVISYRGYDINVGGTTGSVVGCYIHDCDIGIRANGNTSAFYSNNIVVGCITASLFLNSAITVTGIVANNTFYGAENKLGKGVDIKTATTNMYLYNNILYGFVTGVTHADTQVTGIGNYNDYYNNTNDVSASAQWQKGQNDKALDPVFADVVQVTGTAGAFVAGNNKLVDTTKNFTALGVVPGRDFLYITGGTGVTNSGMNVGITSISTTTNSNDTLNLDIAQGTSTTTDKTYQITTGRNFSIGTNLKASGYPDALPGGLTASYVDIGAAQRQETGGGESSHVFIGV